MSLRRARPGAALCAAVLLLLPAAPALASHPPAVRLAQWTLGPPDPQREPSAQPAAETECERIAAFHMLPTSSAEVHETAATDWTRAAALCQADLQAHPGDPRFLYALGRAQDHLKNYIEALRDFRAAADKGHVDAMVELGRLYYAGHGVVQSYPTAFQYFSKAADAGSARALGNVAAMVGNGQGTPRDDAKAIDLAEKAIEAGNPYGLQLVANAYFYGAGVPKDYKMAAQYLQQAIDLGDGQSMKFLANMYESGYLGPPNPAKASELRLQAQKIDPDSQDPIPAHLPLLRQPPPPVPPGQRRRYVVFRPAYAFRRDYGQPMVGTIFRAPAAGATCCPPSALICPGALPRC